MRRSALFRLGVGVAVASSAVLSGCKSPSWWMPGRSTASTSAPSAASGALSGFPAPPNANAAGTPGGLGSTPEPSTTGGVVLASLANVGKKLSQAIQIPTSVTPAVDPVKLDNAPANTTEVAADLHYRAGHFFEMQEKPAEAASHFREALQKSPQDARALAGYGRALARLGNTVEAEAYLTKASAQAPQDPAPHHDLAQFYSQQKNLEAAIRCEQKAVELQPNNPQYRVALASLLLDSGNHADAAHVLAAVFGDAMACFHVGCMLNDRQQSQLARQYMQQSLALNPGLAPAREKLDRWGFAAIPQQSGPGTPNADWR